MKKVSTKKNSLVLTISHYCFILVFGVIAMLACSCKKDNEHIKKTVPFKAAFTTTSITFQTGDPAGNPIQKDHITGNGNGTPIGKASFDLTVSYDITGPSPLLITGTQTITTENGDKIFGTDKGYSPDPDAKGNFFTTGTTTITGGTGKYASATGSLSYKADGSLNSPAGSNSFEGSITY